MRKKALVLAAWALGVAFVVLVFLIIPRSRSNDSALSRPTPSTPAINNNPKDAHQKTLDAPPGRAPARENHINLARIDGLGAINKAKLELSPEDFQALLPYLVQVWADLDPLLALRWLGGQNRHSDISQAACNALIAAAFNKLGATDPANALTALLLLPSDDHKAALKWASQGAATQGKGGDLIEAARYLDVGIRTATEAFALESWVRLNPSEAVIAFQTIVPAADRTEPIRAQMGEAWMSIDPHAASSWWLNSAPDAERRSAIEQIVDIWAAADPGGAAKWLNSIDARSNEEKDAGIRALAYALADQDPRTALEWAKTIQNDFLREETLTSIMDAAPEETFRPMMYHPSHRGVTAQPSQ